MTPLLAAACAGLAAWLSIGELAVTTGSGGELVRIGLLPPVWVLPALIVVSAGAAWVLKLSRATSLPLFCSLLLVLPWIPGQVPPAFLIWTGRTAIGVWACIGVAMLAQSRPGLRRPGAPAGWTQDSYRAPRVAAAVACALYVGSAWWLAGILPGGDEPHYLVISQSLLKDGDLQIENNHARRDYAEYFSGELRPDFLRRGTNGMIYSIHAPGLSAVIAPAYALQGYRGVIVFLSIVAALGGAIMWTAAYGLTESAGAAWFAWAAWALTVPFFFQAFSVFPDGFGATVVLFAALPLLPEKGAGVRPLFLSGVALALLPWLHTRFAIIAVALGGCILLRLMASTDGRSRLFAFLGVPIVSAIAWFAYFRVIYGTFNPAAPYNGYTQSSATNIVTGLPALLFDQQFGILPYAPVYGFCLVGIAALARRRPRLAVELSVTAVLYLLSSSAYHMWWGGSSAAARFAVPVLPLLVLPGACLWKSARHSASRAVAFALLVVSIAITVLAITVDGGQLAYNFRDGYSRLAEWLNPLVDLPQALPSFFRQSSAGAAGRALVWTTSIVLAWLALKNVSSKQGLAAATPIYLAIGAMLATSTVWKLQHIAGPTPDTSELSLLEHVDPRIRPTGFVLARASLTSADAVLSRISISTPLRRPAPPARTLLLIPDVLPAGTYALTVRPSAGTRGPGKADTTDIAAASGVARLLIGRNARPIVSWNLRTDLRDGAVRFDLPVNVGSIVVEGDDEAVR